MERKLSPMEMFTLEILREYSHMVEVNILGQMELSMMAIGKKEK